MLDDVVLRAAGLSKHYRDGSRKLQVLCDVDLSLAAAERVAVVGASGSGKSTLLQLLAGLDTPSAGEVWVSGQSLGALDESERGAWRNRQLGFVYQYHHLLAEFNALENIGLPLLLQGSSVRAAQHRARELLERVGLGARGEHLPAELSGGERQRVAVAQSLITRPRCVLMDEPTGNLDASAAAAVYELIMELNREVGTAFLLATHNMELAASTDRVLRLSDGVLGAD